MPTEKIIPPELQAKVDRELDPDERIQWISTPVHHLLTAGSTIFLLIGIPWTASALFFLINYIRYNNLDGTTAFFACVFYVPSVLIGIGFFCIFFWCHRITRRTIYVITNKRAIVFSGGGPMNWGPFHPVLSYPPDKLKDVFRRERSNEIGDVLVARITYHDSEGVKQSHEFGFLNIENPKEVEGMLKQLAKQSDL